MTRGVRDDWQNFLMVHTWKSSQDDVVNKTRNVEFQVLTFYLSRTIRKQKGFPVWLYTDNHSTWGAEAGGLLWIQCHFGLHWKFQVSDKTGTNNNQPIKIRVSFSRHVESESFASCLGTNLHFTLYVKVETEERITLGTDLKYASI